MVYVVPMSGIFTENTVAIFLIQAAGIFVPLTNLQRGEDIARR